MTLALGVAAIVALFVAILVLVDTKAELMAAGTAAGASFVGVAGLALTIVGLSHRKP
ncbi:hypothetical protein ACFQ0B_28610 [Nonomuraea thailandensis]|uniref:Uncharacterized protein n=1 Tax=Nonomuraea gerenzanensis TaxID=93944 RepID=A0A1M4EKA6_9ACTN|nr:hypothetical protein BN4615_P8750 [Nonomuraea gerenzanensis]